MTITNAGVATFTGGVTAFTLTATDAIYAQDNINLSATKNLYFDGGSNSYMTEYAGDQVKMVVGTQNAMFWRDNNTTIPKDAKLFFDGTSTGVGSTYIWCDNTDEVEFNMGGTLALTLSPTTATFAGKIIQNASPMLIESSSARLSLSRTSNTGTSDLRFASDDAEDDGCWAMRMNPDGGNTTTPSLAIEKWTGTDARVVEFNNDLSTSFSGAVHISGNDNRMALWNDSNGDYGTIHGWQTGGVAGIAFNTDSVANAMVIQKILVGLYPQR